MNPRSGRHGGFGASMVLPLFVVALLMEGPSWVWGNESNALAASGSILAPQGPRVLRVRQVRLSICFLKAALIYAVDGVFLLLRQSMCTSWTRKISCSSHDTC